MVLCDKGMPLQVSMDLITAGPMVLLGNTMAGFHGGAVLLVNVIVGGQTHCNGGLQVALGCKWRRGALREFYCRFPWWRSAVRECN